MKQRAAAQPWRKMTAKVATSGHAHDLDFVGDVRLPVLHALAALEAIRHGCADCPAGFDDQADIALLAELAWSDLQRTRQVLDRLEEFVNQSKTGGVEE
jgi:hypothetical protein